MTYVPEPTDGDIQRSTDLGDHMAEDFIDEAAESDEGLAGIVYAAWVYFTHFLAECGWTADDLAKDAAHHVLIHNEPEGTGRA